MAGIHAWSDGTSVAIVSAPRGEEEKSFPVWFSADGTSFKEGKLDFSATKVDFLNEFDGGTVVPGGRIFKRRNGQVFEAALGVDVKFTPRCEEPDGREFTARAMIAAGKDLWLGGYKGADSAVGWIYASSDGGKKWKKVAEKVPGSVSALRLTANGVLALAYRSVVSVTAAGIKELARFKDLVTEVHVDQRGLFAFGETFTAFVAPGKKAKYGKLLGETDRTRSTRVVAVGERFVMDARGSLHVSDDGLTWAPLEGWAAGRSVRSLVPCAAGALAVTPSAEAFLIA